MNTGAQLEFLRASHAFILWIILSVIVAAVLFYRYRTIIARWKEFGFSASLSKTYLARVLPALLLVSAFAIGYAEPVLVERELVFARNDVEVGYLLDNAGSAAASASADSSTRIERQIAIAMALSRHPSMRGVPTHIGTFTSEATLHLPATAHTSTVLSVLEDVVTVNDPAPGTRCRAGNTCTSFDAVGQAALGFFSDEDEDKKRLLIVFTDGETNNFAEVEVNRKLQSRNIQVIFVDIWQKDEAIFNTSDCVETFLGCIDAGYQEKPEERQRLVQFINRYPHMLLLREEEAQLLPEIVGELIGEANQDNEAEPIEAVVIVRPFAWYFFLVSGLLALMLVASHIRQIGSLISRRWLKR